MRKESFPVLFGFLLEGMKVFTRCPCYLLTAGLLHVIALQCSLMERERAKEQVASFEPSLAVA